MEDRPTVEELEEQLHYVKTSWRDLGVKLNVEDEKLVEIELRFSESRDCLREMLSIWLKQNFMNASRSAIVEALHAIEKHTIADQYTKYILSSITSKKGLNVGPQPLRDRKFKYTKAEEETYSHLGRSTFVSIANSPKISVKTKISHKHAGKELERPQRKFRFWEKACVVIVALILLMLLVLWWFQWDKAVSPIETKIKSRIQIENPETIIAGKLTEVTDMFLLAACLKVKNSKAVIEQLRKSQRDIIEHIRIEVIDIWLKAAEERYWEDLADVLDNCIGNKRLANSLLMEYT